MANQVTLTNCRIVFANALVNTLNGSSQGDWELNFSVYMPSGDTSNERLMGTIAQGASANRIYFSRGATSFTMQNAAAASVSWGSFLSDVVFDDVNTIKIEKLAAATIPTLYINGVSQGVGTSAATWHTVPLFGNLGENFNTFSGLTVSAFSFIDNVNTANNMIFSFDGESATPPISETVDGDNPSFAGAGTPIWSVVGGGSPSADTDVNEGTSINIYTGDGLTGTPVVYINGVSVPYTGTLPNLVVPTDLTALSDVSHLFNLNYPLTLTVEYDAGTLDFGNIIIRSRTGYSLTQLTFPDTGAGTLNDEISGISLNHNDLVYYPIVSGTEVLENGYFYTDAASVDLVIGKFDAGGLGGGVFWYPYTLNLSAYTGPDVTKPVITLTSGTDTITAGDTWVDAGATASDNVDGDITANIVVTGSVDDTTVGTYYKYYNVSDAAGNAADQVTRTVTVNHDVTPDVPDLGADTTGAEPSAYVTRSFVTSGITTAIDWTATGTAEVSLSSGSGFGASVNAGNGVTIYVRLQASASFGGVVSGGVAGDSFSVTTRAQLAPVLAPTKTIYAKVGQALSRTLTIAGGDAATSWTITGGADQASYSLSNAGALTRLANDTEETETITVTATNAAGTSNTQMISIVWRAVNSLPPAYGYEPEDPKVLVPAYGALRPTNVI